MRQTDALNQYVKTYLAPSDIQGVGVFALRSIAKGQNLYADIQPFMFRASHQVLKSELFPEVYEHLLSQWPYITKDEAFAYPTTRIQAWMNHSDDPNYDANTDTVLRDIKKGEEITEDYRKIDVDKKIFTFLEE